MVFLRFYYIKPKKNLNKLIHKKIKQLTTTNNLLQEIKEKHFFIYDFQQDSSAIQTTPKSIKSPTNTNYISKLYIEYIIQFSCLSKLFNSYESQKNKLQALKPQIEFIFETYKLCLEDIQIE